ncbi:hypothetical protein H4582DRAFT_1978320, partial [Lactarius indigo]
ANTESLSSPATAPDPAAADAFVTTGGIIPYPTSVTSTSTPLRSSTSPSAAVTLQHNADLLAPSDLSNHPSASCPILDNTLPTEIMPTTSALTGPVSAPDLHAAIEDDGGLKLGPRNENDALGSPSAIHSIHANTMATLDTPPQSPLLSATDMDPAITGPSTREPNAEGTGEGRPPQPFHCSYDIV